MNTRFRASQFVRLFVATTATALVLVPATSLAQNTVFDSGGTSNSVPNLGVDSNLAFGFAALFYGGSSFNNIGIGYEALFSDTSGTQNTAIGNTTLGANYTGNQNTAIGFEALPSNVLGDGNTATGVVALNSNTLGSYNTANGVRALNSNTTGSNNIAVGYYAGSNLTTGSNNIAIGNPGSAGNSGVIRIGTKGTHKYTFIVGISGVTASNGAAVYVSPNGQLGTLTSSRRFKNDIHDLGAVSDKLMKLRPVAFRYKQAAEDGTHPIQYGLIAEEVAKVYPNLVQYDEAGKPFTVYYHLLTPMLLNELQKEHRQNVAMRAAQKAAQAETASLKAALHTQNSELAALKQSQQQQLAAMAKLTSLVQTSQNRAAVASFTYAQH